MQKIRERWCGTHSVVIRKRGNQMLGYCLGCAQLCDAHGVAMVHHDDYMFPLGLNGCQEDIPVTQDTERLGGCACKY